MKDYLNRFLTAHQKNTGALESGNRQNQQKPDEKTVGALSGEPTKPAKVSFAGFVGNHSQERASFPAEFNEFGENVEMHDSALFAAETCPICHGELIEKDGKDFRHVWCPTPGHFDSWRAKDGKRLKDTDAPIGAYLGEGANV